MQELRGKVAVITGGASGIGKAMAVRFAAEGMKVVLADIDDIHFARLTSADVVRHTLVGQIVDAYTKYDAEKQLQKFESVQSPRKRDRRFGR